MTQIVDLILNDISMDQEPVILEYLVKLLSHLLRVGDDLNQEVLG